MHCVPAPGWYTLFPCTVRNNKRPCESAREQSRARGPGVYRQSGGQRQPWPRLAPSRLRPSRLRRCPLAALARTRARRQATLAPFAAPPSLAALLLALCARKHEHARKTRTTTPRTGMRSRQDGTGTPTCHQGGTRANKVAQKLNSGARLGETRLVNSGLWPKSSQP